MIIIIICNGWTAELSTNVLSYGRCFFPFENSSYLFLKLLTVSEFLTFSGSSFQAGTTLFVKKLCLAGQDFTNCLYNLWCPLVEPAGPKQFEFGLLLSGWNQSTTLIFLLILKYWIKSPLFLLSSRVVNPRVFRRSS